MRSIRPVRPARPAGPALLGDPFGPFFLASDMLMLGSGMLWIAAFAGFALDQGPRLSRPRGSLEDLA